MGDYDDRLAQAQDFAAGWQGRAEAAEAERERLRAIVEDPHGAVEAMHRRLDESMSEQAVLVAERDRLRAVVEVLRFALTLIAAAAPEDAVERHRQVARDALDGSADMGGGTPAPRPDDPSAAPWRVSIVRVGDDRVIRLHVGNFTTGLPALEAHKLGSALHAASGIDTAGHDRQQVGQQYLSNACIHDQHDQCDEECIYCHDGCACSCHPWNAELPSEREALEGEHVPEPTQRPDEA